MCVCLCSSVMCSFNQKIILMHLHPLVGGLHIASAAFLDWNYSNIVMILKHLVYDY